MSKTKLRTFAFINNMQPQYAALTGTVIKGDVCLAGMAQLFIEMAPGSKIYELLDKALKNTNAKPGFQIVEREYGEIELHAFSVEDVKQAGEVIISSMGVSKNERLKPEILSEQIITNVDPYQAQLINRDRHGSLLVPSESLFIMEIEPAGYISIAVNEAEKNANIKIINFDVVGKSGRLYISGTTSEVKAGRSAALNAVKSIEGARGD